MSGISTLRGSFTKRIAMTSFFVLVTLAMVGCGNNDSSLSQGASDTQGVPTTSTTTSLLATSPLNQGDSVDGNASHVTDQVQEPAHRLIPPQSAQGLFDQACANELTVHIQGALAADLTSVSGLAASAKFPDVIWAVEDSFEPSELVALHTNGSTRHAVTVKAGLLANIDWEDLSIWTTPEGVSTVYIADTGDNLFIREALRLLVFPEPDLDTTEVTAEIVRLLFPDGHRANVEAIIVDADGLWLFDKPHERQATTVTTVWHGTHEAIDSGEVHLSAVFELPTGLDAVTAADRSPTGDLVVIRTLAAVHFYHANPNSNLLEILEGTPCQSPPPPEDQGESAAISRDGAGVFTVSEDEQGGSVNLHLTSGEK